MGKGFKLPGVSPLKQEGNSSISLPKFDRSDYRSSAGSYSSPQSVIDTSQGNLLSSAIGTVGDVFSTAINPNPPNVNADGSTGSQNTTTTSRPVYNTNLDRRIANARAKGDMSKVAKLEGRKDRRTQRDKAQAAINEKKANEKLAKQKEKLVNKLNKKGFDGEEVLSTAPVETKINDSGINTDTSGANEKGVTSLILTGQTEKAMEVMKQKREKSKNTSNSVTEMKNDSPLNIFGAAFSALDGMNQAGSLGGATGLGLNNVVQNGKFIGFGGMAEMMRQKNAQQSAGATQAQQAAAASTAAVGASGGQTLNCTPVAMSYDPPLQANEKGGKKSVFNMNTRGMAETAFGTPAMRQASVKSPFEVTAKQEAAFGPDSKLAKEDPAQAKKIYDGIKAGDNSPAASYENPQAVIDHSGGYVAAKALDTFGDLAGKFITKKYGKEEQ